MSLPPERRPAADKTSNGIAAKMVGQAVDGDRPARHLHLSDAVLPFVPRFAAQMIDRPRRQWRRRAVEAAGSAPPEPHRRRCPQRNADDMLEHRTVAVPSDPG